MIKKNIVQKTLNATAQFLMGKFFGAKGFSILCVLGI